jgi:hypothetical protein
MFTRTALPLLVASSLLVTVAARAGDPVAAQSLFDDGKRLMREDRYVEACQKFEESQKMDPGLGTQFHLADCWQHIGRMASAWALFREVESRARATGQVGRVRVAHDRATALELSLSKIVVVPQADAPGLEIRRDGVEIGREQWDWPIPVDAGTHIVTATAPNKLAWQTSVEVPPHGNVVPVHVPPLLDASGVSSIAEPESVAAPGGLPQSSERPTGVTEPMPPSAAEKPVVQNRGGAQRAIAWFLIGAGVAGLSAGAYFGAKWLEDRDAANPHCVNDLCDAVGLEIQSNAHAEERYAGVLLITGGAAVVAGTVLALTAPSARAVVGSSWARALAKARASANFEIEPMLGQHEGGLRLNGVW